MKFLIIIAGLPGTGKTTLSRKIAGHFGFPLLNRDALKENLFDTLGWSDREWSKKLARASYGLLYYIIDQLFFSQQVLLVESNFNNSFDTEPLRNLQQKHQFHVLQIICSTDPEILWDRFQKRSKSGERHPGHVDHLNYDEFRETILAGTYESLDLPGKILQVDTTDFAKIDYPLIYETIGALR